MNCFEFTTWLDEGMPASMESPAREHASRCDRCAALLRTQAEIDAALIAAPALDRARFVDRVMARVASEPRPALRPLAPPLPWWAQAAADPAAVLACALLAIFLWRPSALTEAGRWTLLGTATAVGETRAFLGLDRPMIAMGFCILGLLVLGWLSYHLYRWT